MCMAAGFPEPKIEWFATVGTTPSINWTKLEEEEGKIRIQYDVHSHSSTLEVRERERERIGIRIGF